jgi:hypothetical protein
MELNGHDYIKKLKEKRERKKKRNPMEIFEKKPKKKLSKEYGDKTDKYSKKR